MMTLKHIDNCFYKLSARQAQQLSIENRLPRAGYEMRANPELVKQLVLEYRNRQEPIGQFKEAWIKTTPLSYFDGAPVKDAWTWALHINFHVS